MSDKVLRRAGRAGRGGRGGAGRTQDGHRSCQCGPSLNATSFRVQDKGGIIPALQKLSYAGKNLDDAQRTLEQ